jgi:DNA-binding cell septation regulator SpoVG
MSSAIQDIAIRKTDGTGSIKAFCDIQLGGITLRGCKIIRQGDQRAWLAMPSIKSDRGWNDVVALTKELRARVTEVVLQAWEADADPPPPELEARARQLVHVEGMCGSCLYITACGLPCGCREAA